MAADAVSPAATTSPVVPGEPAPASAPAQQAASADAPRPLGAGEAARYMRHLARELRVLVRDTPIALETLRDQRLRLGIPANWLFHSDAPTLRADAALRLDALALALASEAGARTTLEISGHSDSLGTREFNAAFTLRRAEALGAYLAGKGVAGARMQALGLGESRPLEKVEDTPAARQRNRRIEIEIRPLRPSRRAAS
jgi:outer membrane protein OmpA-like peptidoglycan-associated protein